MSGISLGGFLRSTCNICQQLSLDSDSRAVTAAVGNSKDAATCRAVLALTPALDGLAAVHDVFRRASSHNERKGSAGDLGDAHSAHDVRLVAALQFSWRALIKAHLRHIEESKDLAESAGESVMTICACQAVRNRSKTSNHEK